MIISVNRQLWLFGEQTTEVWWNSGDADFPSNAGGRLHRNGHRRRRYLRPRRRLRSSGWAVTSAGAARCGTPRGMSPTRISTHAIEHALSNSSRLTEAYAFAYQQEGHEFYVLSVPATEDGTEAGDVGLRLLHGPVARADVSERQRRRRAAPRRRRHRRLWGSGGGGPGRTGASTPSSSTTTPTMQDPIRRVRQTPHVDQEEKLIRFNSFELQAEPGTGLEDGTVPLVTLSWSDDGGHTWSQRTRARRQHGRGG
jgi:hypothetical protein